MKIIEISRSTVGLPEGMPARFRVGEPVAEGGHTVSNILYSRDGYSKGVKGHFPSYAIKFAESSEIRVIPMKDVVDIAIDPEEKPTVAQAEAAVELPE